MHDHLNFEEDDYWVIWNGTLGLVDTATIGEIENDCGKRRIWLDEPYDMVGPLDLDELLEIGQVAFAACVVMTRQKWQEDQVELRSKAHKKRRESEARFNERFGSRNRNGFGDAGRNRQQMEQQHRRSLNLPLEGVLEIAQIKLAYRKLARKAHPDVGGSHEAFIRIKKARDELLQSATG